MNLNYVWCQTVEQRVPASRCAFACERTCRDRAELLASPVVQESGRRLKLRGAAREVVRLRPGSAQAQAREGPLVELPAGPGERGPMRAVDPCDKLEAGRTLYRVVARWSVERRLSPAKGAPSLTIEGNGPGARILPLVVHEAGEATLFPSFEALREKGELWADAGEILGVLPQKVVKVLKRK